MTVQTSDRVPMGRGGTRVPACEVRTDSLPCDFGRCHASSVPTFATTDELFAWMESEYLSELRLLSCSPQPQLGEVRALHPREEIVGGREGRHARSVTSETGKAHV